MKRETIALQIYSVRGDLEKDFFGTLRAVKEMGYAGVEFAGLYGHDPLEVKAFCEEIGLKALSAHVSYPEFMGNLEGTVNTYAALGVPYIAIPWLDEERRPGHAGYPEFLEGMKAISAALKEKGIVLSYHNHDFEFEKIDGKYALEVLYDTVPADLLQTELDTCWVNVGGEEPAAYVRKFTGRAPVVHLKDFTGEKSDDMYELIGIERKAPKRPSDFERFMGSPIMVKLYRPRNGLKEIPCVLKAYDSGRITVEAGKETITFEKSEVALVRLRVEF